MAGLGSRFKKENFSTIKPLITIDNKSILEESLKELPHSKNKIVILKKNFHSYIIIRSAIKNIVSYVLFRNSKFLKIDKTKAGEL